MSPVVGNYRRILLFLVLLLVFSGATTWCRGEEVLPIRLVSLINQDDQGELISFPISLFYDYWSSETYLISSTGRITVYDQKYFPVASFGKGRGVINPIGLAVDQRGRIYVCQEADGGGAKARLVIYNQAFFPIKEIDFAAIPELVDFTASKVAVSESGEIYLAGHMGPVSLAGVVVLTSEGKFSRILHPPENDSWRNEPAKEVVSASAAAGDKPGLVNGDVSPVADIPSVVKGLKPKAVAGDRGESEERGKFEPASISDVKIDRQGRIYLLSRETSFIYVLNAKEEYLFKFGEKGGVSGKLSNPVSLAVDLERRTIYVCDYMRHTVLCYDYDSGRYVFEFGGRGYGPLWFNFPNSIEVDQRGRVIVSDLFNRRLQVIDTNMEERRPLAGLFPTKLPAASLPATEEVKVVPELSGPVAVTPLAQVAPLPMPLPVASLPAPKPPEQAVLAQPEVVVVPVAVLAPELPSEVPGVSSLEQSQLTLPATAMPPAMARQEAPRELTPRLVKKLIITFDPKLRVVDFAPVASPRPFAKPATVRVVIEEKVTPPAPTPRRLSDVPAEILESFKSLPAAVAVYGPVATSVGVGSRLLSTKR